jgi:hypothetical protein|uniref:Uncharacterized protein n=1 Tax=Myoviridae sp. ctqfO1 TaxID=2827710 RepID=A0A8S5T3K3_9CAUD|nr:MAG TPA: hypothetical protein [Myoviridae sp. ctqfO1]
MQNKNFTIGEIINAKGVTIVKRTSKDGSITLSIRHGKVQEQKEGKPYSRMKDYFRRLDAAAKAEKGKAATAGKDMDYLFKSDKEMKDRKPAFEMQNGIPCFVKDKKKEAAA